MKDWEKKQQARKTRLEKAARRSRVRRMQIFGVALCVLAFIAMGFTVLPHRAPAVELTVISVSSGDTLWDIAAEHPAPSMNTKETVALIREVNGLGSTNITPGAELQVPATTSAASSQVAVVE